MPNPIDLNLPLLRENHLYQLVHQAEIRRLVTAATQHVVLLHFVEKSALDAFKEPRGKLLTREISIADAYPFVRGSLWNADGKRVSAGYKLVDTLTGKRYNILHLLHSFSLNASLYKAVRLETILSPLVLNTIPALRKSFLATVPDTWVITHESPDKIVIIPCFELLRVFYYEFGEALPAFLFAHEPLATICRSLQAPTSNNQYAGHIELRGEAFEKNQQCIIGELCFNPAYQKTVEATHSNLAVALEQQSAGAYPQVDFHMGHRIHLQANGFEFTIDTQRYFFVGGLWPIENPFSFHELQVDLVVDHRQGPSQGTDHSAPGLEPGAVRLRAESTENFPLDSQLPGNSRYAGVGLEAESRPGASWPTVVTTPKRSPTPHQATSTRYDLQTPEALSQAGGGTDNKRAKVDTITEAERQQQLTTYFEEFVAWFRLNQEYRVRLLTIHNPAHVYGSTISLLAEDDPRGIGIVQLRYAGGYFYFFQLLAKGRAAFVHEVKPTRMTEEEISGLLGRLKEDKLDWVKANRTLLQEQGATKHETHLLLYPRNHHNGGVATAILCEKVMRQQFQA